MNNTETVNKKLKEFYTQAYVCNHIVRETSLWNTEKFAFSNNNAHSWKGLFLLVKAVNGSNIPKDSTECHMRMNKDLRDFGKCSINLFFKPIETVAEGIYLFHNDGVRDYYDD